MKLTKKYYFFISYIEIMKEKTINLLILNVFLKQMIIIIEICDF